MSDNLASIVTFLGFELPTLEDGRIYISSNMLQKHHDHDWYAKFMAREDIKNWWYFDPVKDCAILDLTPEQRAEIEDRAKFPERYSTLFTK